MGYRPITDVWILARCKYRSGTRRYGGFPGGFLERARALLGVSITDPVLHVCAGLVREYPYAGGFGPNDRTLDLDSEMSPDYLQDAREPFPVGFKAVLIDPPYTDADAEKYPPGAKVLPTANQLLRNGLDAVPVGGRVGLLHYVLPSPPTGSAKFIAAIGVMVGFNNRIRVYSVFEKREQ